MTIKEQFEAEIEKLVKAFDSYPFEDKAAYIAWMTQQYYLVQNTTRYLALAAAMTDVNESKSFKNWTHHLEEEFEHDKVLALDMKALGHKEIGPVLPETRGFIGAQYYDMQKFGPNALLGYALMLEGVSVQRCQILAERVEKNFGKRAGFFRLHANVDQDHYRDGMNQVQDLKPELQQVVYNNLTMSSSLYNGILRATLDDLYKKGKKVA